MARSLCVHVFLAQWTVRYFRESPPTTNAVRWQANCLVLHGKAQAAVLALDGLSGTEGLVQLNVLYRMAKGTPTCGGGNVERRTKCEKSRDLMLCWASYLRRRRQRGHPRR